MVQIGNVGPLILFVDAERASNGEAFFYTAAVYNRIIILETV